MSELTSILKYLEKLTINIDGQNVKFTPSGLITETTVQGAIDQIASFIATSKAFKRQTVLFGLTDSSSGQANFLKTGTGLSIGLFATSINLVVTFAYGFENFVETVTLDSDNAWFNLPANQSAVFLYIERTGAEALTYGYSLQVPVYSIVPPSLPIADQHWFDLNNFYMKRWNGSLWEVKQRVFVGECSTDSTSVIPVNYSLRGHYVSPLTQVPAATNRTAFSSNLGLFSQAPPEIMVVNVTADAGYTPGMAVRPSYYTTSAQGPVNVVIESRNLLSDVTASGGWSVPNRTTGAAAVINPAYWKQIVTADRGW